MIRYRLLTAKEPLRCNSKWGHPIKKGEMYYATEEGNVFCEGCHDLDSDTAEEAARAQREE